MYWLPVLMERGITRAERMTLIRSEQEAALDDLSEALQETADYYREAAESLPNGAVAGALRGIAEQRDALAQRLRAAVKSLGDLPRVPDIDRESLHGFLEKLRSVISADNTHRILEQRLHGEHHLAQLVASSRQVSLDRGSAALVDEVAEHVQGTIERLQTLLNGDERSDTR